MNQSAPVSPVTDPFPPEVQPLTGDRSRLHLTVSREFVHKLDAAQDALSHARYGSGWRGALRRRSPGAGDGVPTASPP